MTGYQDDEAMEYNVQQRPTRLVRGTSLPTEAELLQHMVAKSGEIDRKFSLTERLFAQQNQDLINVHQRSDERTQANHDEMLAVQEKHRQESLRRDTQNQTLIDELILQRKEKDEMAAQNREMAAQTRELIQRLEQQTAIHEQALINAYVAVSANRQNVENISRHFADARWTSFMPNNVANETKRKSYAAVKQETGVGDIPHFQRIHSNTSMNSEGARGAAAGNPEGGSPPNDGNAHRRPEGGGGFSPRTPDTRYMPLQQQGIAVGLHEIPKAPKYSGSTKYEKRKFMDEYEQYSREVNLLNFPAV